jgi:hypothetical protein
VKFSKICSGPRRRGVLSYVLVEVGGAPNHERPNRKVNDECKDYFHIIAPSMVCALRCIDGKCRFFSGRMNRVLSGADWRPSRASSRLAERAGQRPRKARFLGGA